nr:hypothetical protein [Tanacetum cinerariifolium]
MTLKLVSAATSVSAVCAKMPVSSHPNIDSLSNAVIFSFFASQSTNPQECRSPKDIRRTGVAEPHRRTALVETSTSNALVSQCDGIESYDWSYQVEEEPANFALIAIPSSSSFDNEMFSHTSLGYLSLEDDSESVSLTCPSDRLSPSGRYHAIPPPITGNFMPPKPDLVFNTAPLAVESDHLAFNVQVSPAKPAQIMSHTTKSMAPIIKDWVSDSEDESKPDNLQSVSVQPIKIPILAATPKPTIKTSSSVHAILLPKSKPVSVTAIRQVSVVVPKIMKSRPRHAHPLNRKSNPSIRRYKTHNLFSKTNISSSKVIAAKVSV